MKTSTTRRQRTHSRRIVGLLSATILLLVLVGGLPSPAAGQDNGPPIAESTALATEPAAVESTRVVENQTSTETASTPEPSSVLTPSLTAVTLVVTSATTTTT